MSDSNLIPVFGEYSYNPDTKRLHYENGREVGSSTYERPLSKNPWYGFWMGARYLNPVDYATLDTAVDMRDWANSLFPRLAWKIVTEEITGDVNYRALSLLASNDMGVTEHFNAGRIAFGKDKNGADAEALSLKAELKLARLLP